MILVGSKALEVFGYDIGTRRDTDYIVAKGWVRPEGCDVIEVSEDVYSELLNHTDQNGVLLPEAMLTLKLSHLPWDNKWEKHCKHATGLMLSGLYPIESLYQTLKAFWEEVYGDKRFLSVSGSKKEFFDDRWVYYKYDHDLLHVLVSEDGTPIYTKCLAEGEEVKIDKSKFDNLSEEDKVRMFKEEVMVIAIERWLVNPHWKGKVGILEAYKMALKKVVTSLTKGWATDFILFNLDKFVNPCYDSINKCLENLGECDMSKVDIKEFVNKFEQETGIKVNNVNDLLLDLAVGDSDSFLWEAYWSINPEVEYKAVSNKLEEVLEKVGYKHLLQEGGGEGGREYCEGVFEMFGKTYKTSWSYYSHHGYEYDYISEDLREVKPVEKVVIVYE